MPAGPIAQAISQWFTTDRSLGCFNQQENESACTIGYNMKYGEVSVYYGDSAGDGLQADALAFVYYDQYQGGNEITFAIAYFHRDGGKYRFIKAFPDITGDGPAITPQSLVKGTTVQFLPGKATFSMVVSAEKDKGLAEKRADEMRLEAACLGALHLLADRGDRAQVHAFRGQFALGDQPFDCFGIESAIDLAEEFCPLPPGCRHSGSHL
jgi:hypothetical protein